MKLIEKKCPNCGSQLSFGDTDKSCRCPYCKSSFEIEREQVDSSDNKTVFNYNLSQLKGPAKIVGTYVLGSFLVTSIVGGLIGLLVLGVFCVAGYFIYQEAKTNFNHNPYNNINEISNSNLKELDEKSNDLIYRNNISSISNFRLNNNVKRIKSYIAYDEEKNENKLLVVYKCNYENEKNINESYTVYIPVTYENVLYSDDFSFIKNGIIEAPALCFKENECVHAYSNIDDFENETIKLLKKDYKVSKK